MPQYTGKWIPFDFYTKFEEKNAVLAGKDIDGHSVYVARMKYEDNLIPGKYDPVRQTCYISNSGLEHASTNFEILQNNDFIWTKTSCGVVPENAVRGGETSSEETLFIGRALHSDCLTPGQVHPSHQCLYIPFEGEEFKKKEYETLVKRDRKLETPVSIQNHEELSDSDEEWRYAGPPSQEHYDGTGVQCKICREKAIGATFIPCGHCSCTGCAEDLKECHICQTAIERFIKLCFI